MTAPIQRTKFAYDEWMEAQGVPIYQGYFVPDVRTIELGWWEERGCKTAFIQLVGQEGVSEARVSEIPPGETLPPYKMAVDEVVYVISGGGATKVWPESDRPEAAHTFEWDTRSLFLIPANQYRQFSNMRGDQPVCLLHYDYLPLAMSVVPDPDFFLKNPYEARTAGMGTSSLTSAPGTTSTATPTAAPGAEHYESSSPART